MLEVHWKYQTIRLPSLPVVFGSFIFIFFSSSSSSCRRFFAKKTATISSPSRLLHETCFAALETLTLENLFLYFVFDFFRLRLVQCFKNKFEKKCFFYIKGNWVQNQQASKLGVRDSIHELCRGKSGDSREGKLLIITGRKATSPLKFFSFRENFLFKFSALDRKPVGSGSRVCVFWCLSCNYFIWKCSQRHPIRKRVCNNVASRSYGWFMFDKTSTSHNEINTVGKGGRRR